jgi:hypothetical protein
VTLPQADKRVAGRYIPLISDEVLAGLAHIEHTTQHEVRTWPPEARAALSDTKVVLHRILLLTTQACAGLPPNKRARGT